MIVNILTGNHFKPVDSPTDINQKTSDTEQSYMFGKAADTLFQSLLEELSASITNNNDRCGSNFLKRLKSVELHNNLQIFREQGQVTRVSQYLNQSLQNSKALKSKDEKLSKSVEMSCKNLPYSAMEAREMLNYLEKHLEGLYISMSYVRLHMQCSPVVEDKHAMISQITALSEKALHNTQLLYDEIRFFHQYSKQMGESDRVVPADTELEYKAGRDSRSARLVSGCVLATAFVVLLFNTRLLTIAIFSE